MVRLGARIRIVGGSRVNSSGLARAAVVAYLLSCSCSGAPESSPSPGEASPGAFCRESWRVSTARFVECLLRGASEMAARAEDAGAACDAIQAAADAGRIRFDDAAAASCLAAEATQACEELRNTFTLAACDAALTGALPNGAACSSTLECADGFCDTSATCPGTCSAFAQPDADCSATPCGPGQVCDGATSRCVAKTPPGGPGEPCANDLPYCDPGLRCAFETCIPRLPTGEPCQSTADCATGLYCPPPYSPLAGSCAPRVPEGQPCAEDAACVPGTSCAPTVCEPPPSAGEPCSATCLGGYCDLNGRCAAYRTLGEPCGSGVECSPHLACVAGACASACYY